MFEKYLAEWGFSNLIEKFKEEEIDEEAFNQLQYETIKDLIPRAGPRQKFWLCYKRHMGILNKEPSDAGSTISYLSGGSCSALLTKPVDIDIINCESENDLETTLSSKSVDIEYISSEPQVIYGSNLENFLNSSILTASNNKLGSNNVKDYLKTANGSIVSSYYEINKKLSNRERNLLANVVIQKEFEHFKDNFRINTERFKCLAKQIIEIFPTESEEIYYTPYEPKTKILASGKLWECFNRLKRNLRQNSVLATSTQATTSDLPNKDITGAIFFLKNNLQPIDKIKKYWNDTFDHRLNLLKSPSSKLSISEYLNAFPILKSAKGCYFLSYDFEQLYPQSINNLFVYWPTINQKLIQKAKAEFEKEYEDNYIENDLTGFFLLPRLLRSCAYSRKRDSSKRIKYTLQEISESFILQIQDANLLEEKLEDIRNQARKNKGTLQPTVVLAGESLDKISVSYVAIDDALFAVDSPLVAVDICFKAFSALNAKFPQASEPVWTFIQQRVYNIRTEYDRHSVTVSSLITDTN